MFEKIWQVNLILIGYCEMLVLFFYVDVGGKVIGFLQDLCECVIVVVKVCIGKFDLQVCFILVMLQNCILFVQNGIVDFECGVMINFVVCYVQVVFLIIFFVVMMCLFMCIMLGICDFFDLVGKMVVMNQGMMFECLLCKMNEEKKMNMQIISVKDYGEGCLMFELGCVVVYMMDDVLFVGVCQFVVKLVDWWFVGML